MIYFFEDVVVGWKHDIGPYSPTRDEIVRFAEQYDPQPFHLLDAAASDSIFGGIVASGWHSCAMAMRMSVDHFRTIPGWQEAASAALGVDQLRFLGAVRPGDVLHGSLEILEKRESRSRPDYGILKIRVELTNQKDEDVLSFIASVLHRRRPVPGSVALNV